MFMMRSMGPKKCGMRPSVAAHAVRWAMLVSPDGRELRSAASGKTSRAGSSLTGLRSGMLGEWQVCTSSHASKLYCTHALCGKFDADLVGDLRRTDRVKVIGRSWSIHNEATVYASVPRGSPGEHQGCSQSGQAASVEGVGVGSIGAFRAFSSQRGVP